MESSDSSIEKSKKIEEAAKEMSRTIASTGRRVQKIKDARKGEGIKKTVVSLQSNVEGIKKSLTKATQSRQAPITKEATSELDKVYVAVSNMELSTLEVLLETVETETSGIETELKDKTEDAIAEAEDEKTFVDESQKNELTNKSTVEPSEASVNQPSPEQEVYTKKEGQDIEETKAHITYNLNKAIQEIEADLKSLNEQIKTRQEEEVVISDAPQEGEKLYDSNATVTEIVLNVETILVEKRKSAELQNIYDEIEKSLDNAKNFMKKGDLKKALDAVEYMRTLLQST